jgi:diguanylate cyclase (GGDEF)-like protein
METGLKVSIEFLCSQFALLMFAGLQDKAERNHLDYRLFVGMMAAVLVELVADSARLIADGSATGLGQWILRNAVFVLYAASAQATMMYAIYVENQTFRYGRRPRKRIVLYTLPGVAIICLSFASIFTGWFFSFDASGRYAPGRFAYASYLVSYGYLFFALAVAFRRRKTLSSRDFASLVSFPVPMAVLGVAQCLMPEYVILLPAQTLSLLCLYTNIQERRLTYDYLTGAYNRRRLDEHLGTMIADPRRSGRPFAAFLADVNDFKSINDRFGHKTGDEALIEVVRIVKASLRRDDFLARYAGDEFVAVLPCCDEAELASVAARIDRAFESASGASARYPLSISVGAAVFDPALDLDPDGYVKRLDSLMYAAKRARKARLRAQE